MGLWQRTSLKTFRRKPDSTARGPALLSQGGGRGAEKGGGEERHIETHTEISEKGKGDVERGRHVEIHRETCKDEMGTDAHTENREQEVSEASALQSLAFWPFSPWDISFGVGPLGPAGVVSFRLLRLVESCGGELPPPAFRLYYAFEPCTRSCGRKHTLRSHAMRLATG